jgi:hypothetical protein
MGKTQSNNTPRHGHSDDVSEKMLTLGKFEEFISRLNFERIKGMRQTE